jgi:hypothetical protein
VPFVDFCHNYHTARTNQARYHQHLISYATNFVVLTRSQVQLKLLKNCIVALATCSASMQQEARHPFTQLLAVLRLDLGSRASLGLGLGCHSQRRNPTAVLATRMRWGPAHPLKTHANRRQL